MKNKNLSKRTAKEDQTRDPIGRRLSPFVGRRTRWSERGVYGVAGIVIAENKKAQA